MQTVMPMIVVEDIDAVSDYYQSTLGFEQTMSMRSPDGKLFMAMLNSGEDTGLMFTAVQPDSEPSTPLSPEGIVIYLATDDVDGYHDRIAGNAGVTVVEEPTDQFWGDRTLLIRDPWGLHLQFAQHTGQMSAPPEGFEIEMAQPVG